MKKLRAKEQWVIAAAALILIGGTRARADERIAAKVPFAFIVGDTYLPAGDYVVEETPDNPSVIFIENTRDRKFVYTLTIPSSSHVMTAEPSLVFEKFDNQYFLARVVPPDGSEREIVLTPASMQRELLKVAVEP